MTHSIGNHNIQQNILKIDGFMGQLEKIKLKIRTIFEFSQQKSEKSVEKFVESVNLCVTWMISIRENVLGQVEKCLSENLMFKRTLFEEIDNFYSEIWEARRCLLFENNEIFEKVCLKFPSIHNIIENDCNFHTFLYRKVNDWQELLEKIVEINHKSIGLNEKIQKIHKEKWIAVDRINKKVWHFPKEIEKKLEKGLKSKSCMFYISEFQNDPDFAIVNFQTMQLTHIKSLNSYELLKTSREKLVLE